MVCGSFHGAGETFRARATLHHLPMPWNEAICSSPSFKRLKSVCPTWTSSFNPSRWLGVKGGDARFERKKPMKAHDRIKTARKIFDKEIKSARLSSKQNPWNPRQSAHDFLKIQLGNIRTEPQCDLSLHSSSSQGAKAGTRRSVFGLFCRLSQWSDRRMPTVTSPAHSKP